MPNKVRTFSVELLCNIEWLEEQTKTPTAFAKLKKEIKAFIFEKSLNAKASMSEYAVFLNSLSSLVKPEELSPEISQKFKRILDKHQELILLQSKIKSKPPLRFSQKLWGRLRNFVRAGLAGKAAEPPFQTIVPVPFETHYLNLFPLIDASNRLEPECRAAGQWLFEHLKILSFKELCASIKEGCESIAQTLQSYDGYHVLISREKSQEWVAHIGSRYLPKNKLPISVLNVFPGQGSKFKNFIMFDDALYSGAQLEVFLESIYKLCWSERDMNNEKVNIIIIVGFASKVGQERVQEAIEKLVKFKVHVSLVCKRSFNDIKTDWIADNVSEDLKDKILQIVESSEESIHKTTAITEWKNPDCWSTPRFVSEGHTRWPRRFTDEKRTIEGYLNACKPFDADEKPVVDIKKPYGKRG